MKKRFFLTILTFFLFAFFSAPAVAKKEITNKIGIKLVFISPGSFLMGSPVSEVGREKDETLHRVFINKGFFISTTEVTQGQWKKLMGANPSAYQELGDKGPVDQVSWHDCQAFIKTLNERENTNSYRLPTEAEWEYACRAGTQTAFAGGAIKEASCKRYSSLDKMAWYCGNSGHKPHRVAQKEPNAWGLYDMHGNVHEWCLDRCGWRDMWSRRVNVITNTYKNNITDPLSKTGDSRVFRGGSWNQSSQYQRSADRGCFHPALKRTDIGFRIIKTDTPKLKQGFGYGN